MIGGSKSTEVRPPSGNIRSTRELGSGRRTDRGLAAKEVRLLDRALIRAKKQKTKKDRARSLATGALRPLI